MGKIKLPKYCVEVKLIPVSIFISFQIVNIFLIKLYHCLDQGLKSCLVKFQDDQIDRGSAQWSN